MPSIILAIGLAAPRQAGATVTVTDNGNGTVTMANGLISIIVNKSNGSVSSIINTKALPGVNLIETSAIGLELTHIGETGSNDYWTDISAGGTEVYSVVVNSGSMVDIQIQNPTASPDQVTYPNGLWDWTIHHVMRDGDPGFYTYHVWRHHEDQPESYWDADSWQGYTNGSLFAASPVINAWDFCGVMKNGISFGGGLPDPTNDGVPAEVNIFPMVSYFTQPTGAYYEPGWPIYTQPTGLTQDLYPTWTKYDWPTYLGPYTSYRNTWGVCNDVVGLWHCNGSSEWRNGGPTKLSGAMSGDYMYMDDDEGHGLGGTNTNVLPTPMGTGVSGTGVVIETGTSPVTFVKMIGPFFTYVNSGTNHNELWADAQARGAQEAANWPYGWVDETEHDYPRNRGTVTGQLTTTNGQSTANAVVILGMPITTTYPDWIWQGTINYLYWTTADSQGNFTIPKVNPGTYTLYSYVPGIFASGTNPSGSVSGPGFVSNGSGGYISSNGEYVQNNVTVTASGTTSLGTIAWSPPRAQNLIFQLGIPDRSTTEFRFGDLIKQFGLWWRYYNEMGTNQLNFNVGTSNVANNWYYAQPIFALPNGTYCFPQWNINFNVPATVSGPLTLTVNLAGGYGTYFYVYLDGKNVTPGSYNYAGIPTNSGADIYRDVVQIGQFQQYLVSLGSGGLSAGQHTLSITVRQPGFNATWATTGPYPDLVAGGLMYDAIKLEGGPLVTQMIQNGIYKIGSGLNGFVAESSTTTNNGSVIEWPFQYQLNEEWYINDIGNDVYTIVNQNTGMALSVLNSSTAVGAAVVQTAFTAPGTTSQQWHAVLNTSGGISLINENSGLALDITGQRSDYQNNVQLIQNTSNNSLSQSWYETPQTFGPPPAPTGLTVMAGNGQANLSWTASERATGYTIMRGTSGGNETTTVAANVANTSYTDTNLTNGVPYYYVVVATNSTGGSSANSNEANTTPVPPVPSAPANLVATVGNGQSVLTWTASPNATSYTVLRGTASGGENTVIASKVSVTSATDTGLTNGMTYYYVATAANLSGTSGNSNEASVTPTASAPGTPSNLAVMGGNDAVALSWLPATGAASYIILRGTTSGTYTTSVSINAASTTYTDTTVTNGVTYYYVVEASNSNGTTGNSNQVSVSPASNPPAAPMGLTATGSNQQISLAWNSSTGATGYTLVRGTTSGVYTATLAANTTIRTFTDTGLLNGMTYYYAVSAASLAGTSGYSTQASATPTRPSGTVTWMGNSSSTWDMTTQNWQYGSGATTYQNGDSVIFGNSGNPNNQNLFLFSNFSPANITVNATNLSYAFGGVGSITGTTGLTYTGGTNTLTIGVANSYSGPTAIQSGTLVLLNPGSLGTSKITFGNNTMLEASPFGTQAFGLNNNTCIVPAGVTASIVMGSGMSLGPVTGGGVVNIIASSGSNAVKGDNFVGGWGGNFTGTLNISSTNVGGSQLTAWYNGGNPSFDGNVGNATVNMNDVGFCSWDNSGGNTLTFGALNGTSTADFVGSAYAGGMTINIGGLNTNSVFAGSISNSAGGGNTTVIKSGTGSLTLSGSCAYAGATSVTKGSLVVNGMLSGTVGTALTVSSGASLGGTGSILGTVTVNSGGSLLLSSTGNLAVTGTVAFGGSVSVAPAASTFLGPGTYTLLTYTGTENGTPVFSYVAPHGVNQTATFNTSTPGQILVTITGPPAAPAALTATAGNGQVALTWTASPTATSYLIQRGTSSGNETTIVSGTDTSASFTDTGVTNGTIYYYIVTGSNSYGNGAVSNEASATPAETLSQWIAAAFPGVTNTNIVGLTAEPEGDGIANLLKYFMGISPNSAAPPPLTCGSDGQGDIVLYFRMAKGLTGVSYGIQQSTDGINWSNTGLQGTVVADMGSYYTMKVVLPMAGNSDLLLRLSVSSP